MKKIFVFIFLFTTLFLTSCFKEEVVPIIEPSYEEIGIFNDHLSVYGSGVSIPNDKILSFKVQKNKFTLDKDLNFFNDKYSYILKSKNLNSNSYIGIKLISFEDIRLNLGKDIERVFQEKNIKYKLNNSLGDCIINKEGTQYGNGATYITTCNKNDYIIQLTGNPYTNKQGKKEIGYKGIAIDKKIKEFIINEYFNNKNNIDSFDTSFIPYDKKNILKYTYLDNVPNYNGYITLSQGKTTIATYATNKKIMFKDGYIVIFDILLEKSEMSTQNILDNTSSKIDVRFPLIKDEKLSLKNFDLSKMPGRFNQEYILNNHYIVDINQFLLFRKDESNGKKTSFVGRFPHTMKVDIYNNTKTLYGDNFLNNFLYNFEYKPGFSGPVVNRNFTQYTYKGEKTTFILLKGNNIKGNNQFKGNYIYVEINNDFINTNLNTFKNFVGVIK